MCTPTFSSSLAHTMGSKQAALPADLWEEADLSDEASMPSALAGIDNNSGASMPAALVGRPGAEPLVSDIPMHIVQRNRLDVSVKNEMSSQEYI